MAFQWDFHHPMRQEWGISQMWMWENLAPHSLCQESPLMCRTLQKSILWFSQETPWMINFRNKCYHINMNHVVSDSLHTSSYLILLIWEVSSVISFTREDSEVPRDNESSSHWSQQQNQDVGQQGQSGRQECGVHAWEGGSRPVGLILSGLLLLNSMSSLSIRASVLTSLSSGPGIYGATL